MLNIKAVVLVIIVITIGPWLLVHGVMLAVKTYKKER